jgi:2',3'-cyclic-nucleotide 2'-phosphodiesterase (5'-nucleotidase family)
MIPNRRDFLKTGAAASVAALAPTLASAAEDRLTTISIIHTTDLHGNVLPTHTYEGVPDVGGLARCATQIRRWRAENPNSLLIDVGDIYQGTHLSRQNEGRLMIDLMNRLRYDAWVLGNHEFDWGIGVVEDIVDRSACPVLTANIELAGKRSGTQGDDGHPFAKIAPSMIREVAGFKIGIAGIITPGLSYWLPEDLTKGIKALDPAPITAAAAKRMREEGADAVIVAGHMGSKFGKDDFANRVDDVLTQSVGTVDAFIAGHTHRDLPSMRIQRALYTQAGYFGIYLGRVDLTFDRETRKLVDRRAFTILMDDRFDLDPLVLERAKDEIEISEKTLAKPVGILSQPIGTTTSPGKPSSMSMLIGAAIVHSLAKQGTKVDAVVHGQFLDDEIAAGELTLADVWKIVPYENRVVTASLDTEQLKVVLEEMFATSHSKRNVMGLGTAIRKTGGRTMVEAFSNPDGSPVEPKSKMRIAFNSFDARSGGQRFMKLRQILAEPESETRLEPVETRAALADYFADHKEISPASLEAQLRG